MPSRIDVPPGTVFNQLTVLSEASRVSSGRAFLCQCSCGKQTTVSMCHLRTGRTISCGHMRVGERGANRPDPVEGAEWIPLAGNHWALMDLDDVIRFNGVLWHITIGGYAANSTKGSGAYRQRFMHREVLGLGPVKVDPVEVDHINGNRLDNRKANLRIATHQENARNVKPRPGAFKRVDRHGRGWRAQIKQGGKTYYLGTFDTPEQAAEAYNRAAVERFGVFAHLNTVG